MDESFVDKLQDRENLVVAEIGVLEADNAQRLQNELDIGVMYLIDPYTNYAEYTGIRQDNAWLSETKRIAHNNMKSFSNIIWIEEFSHEAPKYIDRPLDLVYIDGNHDYKYAKRDMEIFYELLSDDGILAGHDIDRRGVSKALGEFCTERDLQSNIEKNNSEWYVEKGV